MYYRNFLPSGNSSEEWFSCRRNLLFCRSYSEFLHNSRPAQKLEPIEQEYIEILSILNISCSPIRILNSDTWWNEKDKFDNIIIWAKIERGLNHHFNCIRLDFFIFCTCSYLENDCLLPPFRSYPLLRPNNGCTKNFISRPIIYRSARKKKTIIIPR